MRDKLRMDRLNLTLEHSASEVDWWEALCAFGKECDWLSLEWNGPQGRFHTRLRDKSKVAWSISVPLHELGALRIDGGQESQNQSVDLPALVTVLQESVSSNESRWRALRS